MALYRNANKGSGITSVEFSKVSSGTLSFIACRDASEAEKLGMWLTSAEMGQTIVAHTEVGSQPMLVTAGAKSGEEILQALGSRGERFEEYHPRPGFQPWKWRGNLSNAGQVLQLLSAGMGPKGIDAGTMGFALANLTANMTNIIFGAEKCADPHRLHFLKEAFNEQLRAYLPEGVSPPDTTVDAATTYQKTPMPPRGNPVIDFMKHHSVSVGEIGLRYFGALNLVFPVNQWKKGFAALEEKGIAEAYEAMRNPNPASYKVGLAYLAGKTVALCAKAPDPYNPKPHSLLDNLREKVFFRAGSVIEGGAAALLSWDRLSKSPSGKPKIAVKGKLVPSAMEAEWQRDWFGGIGGLLFTTGFAIRLGAPFGVREVNMEELRAHITEGLSRVPKEKLPQLVADVAAFMKTHFGEQAPDYGTIFTQLSGELDRYHHVALPMGGEKVSQAAAASTLVAEPKTRLSPVAVASIEKMKTPEVQLGA